MKKYDASEKAKIRRKRWEIENATQQKESKRAQYLANKEKVIRRAAEWAKKNQDRRKEIVKKFSRTERGRQNSLNSRWNRIAREKAVGGKVKKSEFLDLCTEFENHCLRCLKQFEANKLTRDHVMPICEGGENVIENLQPLCIKCNQAKGGVKLDYRSSFWLRMDFQAIGIDASP